MSSLDEKELEMLRDAVDRAQRRQGRERLQDPAIKSIIQIVEDFIASKKLICYGGTAINNILPVGLQFYDKNTEFPDYDFYSSNALKDAVRLADIYSSRGFSEVEAKSGVHHGTYKVYVNFVPVADITQLPAKLFNSLKKSAVIVDGIHYAPPDFLRMSMYLELSRPDGDVSRWEKVLKRLTLLNKYYPMKDPKCKTKKTVRHFVGAASVGRKSYRIIQNEAVHLGLVFFGGYATSTIAGSKPRGSDPDFDLLSNNAHTDSQLIARKLEDANMGRVSVKKRPGLWEVVPIHYEISVGEDIVAVVYETLGCHNYNKVKVGHQEIRIATFDTMLSLWLAFLYDARQSLNKDRIYCMSQALYNMQKKRRLRRRGPLQRFGPDCIGTQPTLESVRAEKGRKYEELKDRKDSDEWKSWFLNYKPSGRRSPKKSRRRKKPTKGKSTRSKSTRSNRKI